MKKFLLGLCLLALPAAGHAEEVWRWTDAHGTTHYSNVQARVPADAEAVKTRIVREVSRIPDAQSDLTMADGRIVERQAATSGPTRRRDKRIYNRERLSFGCWATKVLYFGGWSHADDISPVLNCYPFMMGSPEAWLNAARAELAIRQNGIDLRSMIQAWDESRTAVE
ncbi:MAG: DUF4124 domain-containing protein [bacterium]|nr:DUF4124 domain-containing protein [bacterium]